MDELRQASNDGKKRGRVQGGACEQTRSAFAGSAHKARLWKSFYQFLGNFIRIPPCLIFCFSLPGKSVYPPLISSSQHRQSLYWATRSAAASAVSIWASDGCLWKLQFTPLFGSRSRDSRLGFLWNTSTSTSADASAGQTLNASWAIRTNHIPTELTLPCTSSRWVIICAPCPCESLAFPFFLCNFASSST